MNQAATINNLSQQLTQLAGDRQARCDVIEQHQSARGDVREKRQRLLRDRTKDQTEKQTIQTSLNNHGLRAIQTTEIDAYVRTHITALVLAWVDHNA